MQIAFARILTSSTQWIQKKVITLSRMKMGVSRKAVAQLTVELISDQSLHLSTSQKENLGKVSVALSNLNRWWEEEVIKEKMTETAHWKKKKMERQSILKSMQIVRWQVIRLRNQETETI